MSRTRHHGEKAKEKLFGKVWHWFQSTPSWWTNLTMNKPKRHKQNTELKQSLKLDKEEILNFEVADTKKKPHKYYW